MKKQKSLLISTIVLGVLSIAFTLLICLVDKSNIGPQNSSVGLSKLNQIFKNLFGYNELFYKLTQVLGYIVIGLALAYMVIAFIQLIKRKSIKNIDIQLSLLAIFYSIIIAIYFVFELAKINYRPVILDGELEPSYPSSHTMLARVEEQRVHFTTSFLYGTDTRALEKVCDYDIIVVRGMTGRAGTG